MWSSFEDQIDAAVNFVDAAIFAPANTWLRENVSVGGQYLALFLMLVVMALHLVWTKEKRTNCTLSCMLFCLFRLLGSMVIDDFLPKPPDIASLAWVYVGNTLGFRGWCISTVKFAYTT
jgi:hypothetical protein